MSATSQSEIARIARELAALADVTRGRAHTPLAGAARLLKQAAQCAPDRHAVIYAIPAPNSRTAKIEVYGDRDNAWYEWRIIDADRVVRDTSTDGHAAFRGRQYGQPEIALRDALIFATEES